MHIRRNIIAPPDWWHDYRSGALPSGSSFTRGSSAYGWDATPQLASFASDTARYDHDPLTGAPLGLQLEPAATNLLLYSEALDNAAWSLSHNTLTAAQTTAPDGANTGYKLVENADGGAFELYQFVTLAADTYVGLSLFFKPATRTRFWIDLYGAASNHYAAAVFDTSTGTVSQTTVGSSSGTIASTQLRQVGGGWWRGGLVAKVANANPAFIFGPAPAATGNTFDSVGQLRYTGDGSSYAYYWGASLESAGVGVGSYIKTTSATVTRSQDVHSIPLSSVRGWDAAKGGVFVATYRLHTMFPSVPGYNQVPLFASASGSANDAIALFGQYGGAGTFGGFRARSGTFASVIAGAVSLPFVRRRLALGWQADRVAVAYDGNLLGSNTTTLALNSDLATLDIGKYGGHGLGGTLESVAYYAGARADAFLQAATR